MPRGRPKKDVASSGAAQPTKSVKSNGNGANLGFEAQMFLAADKLRRTWSRRTTSMSLGLIFLKHISNAFEANTRHCWPRSPPRKTRTNTSPRTCSGCRRGALVAPPGERQAADHREADRRRHERDRGGEPRSQGRAAEGL